MSSPVQSTPQSEPQSEPQSRRRKLRPDAHTVLRERRRVRVNGLYEKPVEELTPEEIRRMKRAFFGV